MLISFNEQWCIVGWRKLNRPKGTYLKRWETNPTDHTLPRRNKSLCLSLSKMISNGLDSVPNKLIVMRVSIQNSNNALQTMQNGRSTQALFFQQIPAGFLKAGYTCFLFNCYRAWSLSLFLFQFFFYFYLILFSCFPHSPNFIAGHSPMYNSWVTRLFYTPRTKQPCCAALRGSQPSQPIICLHTEQPAHSSLHQLHSIPGMALSLTWGWSWSSCPLKRHWE